MKVLFYPDAGIQHRGHSLSKTIRYFKILGYKITNDINSDWDIGVHWNYKDINKTPDILLNDSRLVLNKNVNNVTKSYVDKIFTEVFGYSSLADTNKFGYCVRKSERQSAHDGVITRMPCEKQPGYVYQLFLDNRMSRNMVYDIRIIYMLGNIYQVVLKGRLVEGTFENTLSKQKKYWIDQVENWLTKYEIKKIKLFCEAFGLDIGELDGIRDNSTGKLFIIDVNNLPGSGLYNNVKNEKEVELKLAMHLKSLI